MFNVNASPFPVMSGEMHHIHLKPDHQLYAVHSPIPLPHHWKTDVKKLLDEYVQAGIIIPVDVGEAVDWCTRMVVIPKKDGSPRITVDFQELNKYIKRETHHTSYPFNVVNNVPIHSYKTVADAKNGYNQVMLDDSSSKLTTFITEFGRYKFI